MDYGRETLELVFQDGHLEQWYWHDQANRPPPLETLLRHQTAGPYPGTHRFHIKPLVVVVGAR
jgi:hypothetical protein